MKCGVQAVLNSCQQCVLVAGIWGAPVARSGLGIEENMLLDQNLEVSGFVRAVVS